MEKVGQFPEKFDISVSVASGVESVLKKEISRLGYGEHPAENGRITFKGDKLALARLNVNLRTADRVYVKVGEFTANTFDELFDGVNALNWEDFIPYDAEVVVDGKCVKSKLFSVSDCQKIVKKSIVKRLCSKCGLIRLSETGDRIEIVFSLFKDKAELLINASGKGLHKRGYKDLVGIAPIKETLASALLLMSDFYYKRPFYDPFSGSGTLVIEGAMIALNIAPGKNRNFAFSSFNGFEDKFLKLAKEEALDNEKLDREIAFYGSDIDKKAVALAKRHAIRAGVGEKVSFRTLDVKDLILPSEFGTIVSNPPYGERVYDREEARLCYKYLGENLKKRDGWSAFIITADKGFERAFGKRADRTRKMYNSNKECGFYYYYGKKEERK